MKLSVFSPVLADKSLVDAVKYLKTLGVDSMEMGCGGYPGTAHLNARELVKNKALAAEKKAIFDDNGMEICALSSHGNPLHPNKEIAKSYHEDYLAAFELAGMWGVDTVIGFSGCPGDCDDSKYPNWVTCAWPEDFLAVKEYQWEKLIAYWQKTAAAAADFGVKKIAFEMHPGFCVYNPESLMTLRNAVGDIIGANFDPSHLIWQGIDPVAAIRYLNRAIYHFHAKDTKVDDRNTAINGVLDLKHYSDELNRSWIFRTVGYGTGADKWKDMFSALNLVGYNGAVSIEHEDSLMTCKEGLEKAVRFLQGILIEEPKPGKMFWA